MDSTSPGSIPPSSPGPTLLVRCMPLLPLYFRCYCRFCVVVAVSLCCCCFRYCCGYCCCCCFCCFFSLECYIPNPRRCLIALSHTLRHHSPLRTAVNCDLSVSLSDVHSALETETPSNSPERARVRVSPIPLFQPN